MKTATISEAKNRLSEYLRAVKRGEQVLILDRRIPVARLVPVDPVGDFDEPARLAVLERTGVIRRARRKGVAKLLLQPPPKLPRGMSVLEALLAERRRGR